MTLTAPKLTRIWGDRLSDYITALTWSADGQWLAVATAAGEVMMGQVPGPLIGLAQADGLSISRLAFSPDGAWLAAAGQAGRITLWPLTSPGAPLSQSHLGVWIDQLAWHPQHPYLAYGAGSRVYLWHPQQRQPEATLELPTSSVLHLAWHPQGTHLAVSGHGGIRVWSALDWAAAATLIAVPGASLHVAWSADGRYLGSGNLDRTLTVAEWGKPPPWLMQGFPGKVRQVAWSEPETAAGSPLIAAACAEAVTLWQRDDTANTWRSQVLAHRDRVNALGFQPHSLRLAAVSQNGDICLWDPRPSPIQTLKFPEGSGSTLAWHPGGELLAIGGTTGTLGLWQLSRSRAQGFG